MRTSGAPTDTPLPIAVCLVALGLLILFAGGPWEFLRVLDQAFRAAADTLFQAYQNFRV